MKHVDFGIFMPMANGGWIISETAPKIDASFALNKRVAILGETLGYDFLLSMMKWRGYGGHTNHWGVSLESNILMAALSQVTERIKIWTTVHTILHHPAVVAKMLATLDQASNGRAGMNIVSGAYRGEFEQMGMWPAHLDHDRRYDLAREWITVVQRLWQQDRVDFQGEFFQLADCVCDPKPVSRPRPQLICAGASEAGLHYTAEFADAAFVHGQTEPEIAATSRRAKNIAAAKGKTIKTYAMYTIIPGATDAEAMARLAYFKTGVDQEAVRGMIASYGLKPDGRESALVHRAREGFMTSYLVGGADSLRQQIESTIAAADLDGMMLVFPDYIEDLQFFGTQILPQLRQPANAAVPA